MTVTEKRFFEWSEDDVSVTLRHSGGSFGGVRSVGHLLYQDKVGALCATDYKWVQQEQVEQGKLIVEKEMMDIFTSTKASYHTAFDDSDKAQTLVATDYKDPQTVTKVREYNTVVRRLTPLECERLQGFPDNYTDIGAWTDTKGKLHKESSDSARYKALGNSICLPYWAWITKRISAQYERPATLGSLFDGIGGFPLCWERCNGRGTARWASEIEEFPMAVTRAHFPEE